MMSYEDPPQSKLFYMGINIDKRIRKNHPLRKIEELIDFDFIYNEVKDKYGYNGNESIPPPVILKLMLLLVLYNVRSESGLVDGRKIFVDSSLIQADASNNSVVDTKSLKRYLNESYKELEKRLEEESDDEEGNDDESGGVNSRYISTTDPDASIVRTSGSGERRS